MKINEGFPDNLKNEEDREIAFEQYKILTESINAISDAKVQANIFWTTVNGVAISALAYIKDADNLSGSHISAVLWTIIILGLGISISWVSYLVTIVKQVEIRNNMLMELERYFPIPLFRNIFTATQVKPGNPTITIKEMMVPIFFIIGYLFFAVILLYFSDEVAAACKG